MTMPSHYTRWNPRALLRSPIQPRICNFETVTNYRRFDHAVLVVAASVAAMIFILWVVILR
jgi:hypothetical protein